MFPLALTLPHLIQFQFQFQFQSSHVNTGPEKRGGRSDVLLSHAAKGKTNSSRRILSEARKRDPPKRNQNTQKTQKTQRKAIKTQKRNAALLG